jgi:protein-tyrosine phosphatase
MNRSILLAFLALLPAPVLAETPQAVVQQAPSAAARFIAVDGSRNFRDIGGYRTADGRTVKWGVMYRSGSLGKLTPAGQATLAKLRVASEIDLRTTEERARDTYDLRRAIPGYWARDYGMSLGATTQALPDFSKMTAAGARAMMIHVYRTLPREQAPAYREMFARLETQAGPLVLNCTAGKDRTGVGAALVLTALGVPYETVRQDFLLSNGAPGMDTLGADIAMPAVKLPAEVMAPVVGVESAYLDTAFAQIRQDYGSVEAYMQKELGVGPREIAVLKARMLDK